MRNTASAVRRKCTVLNAALKKKGCKSAAKTFTLKTRILNLKKVEERKSYKENNNVGNRKTREK